MKAISNLITNISSLRTSNKNNSQSNSMVRSNYIKKYDIGNQMLFGGINRNYIKNRIHLENNLLFNSKSSRLSLIEQAQKKVFLNELGRADTRYVSRISQ